MAGRLTYLAGLPHHGYPLVFSPQLIRPPKILWRRIGRPTSLTGGERPGGNEFAGLKGRKSFSTHNVKSFKRMTHLSTRPGAFVGPRRLLWEWGKARSSINIQRCNRDWSQLKLRKNGNRQYSPYTRLRWKMEEFEWKMDKVIIRDQKKLVRWAKVPGIWDSRVSQK